MVNVFHITDTNFKKFEMIVHLNGEVEDISLYKIGLAIKKTFFIC